MALKIPVAGIEGFHALAAEHEHKEYDTLILQNAFGNQLYYYHVNRTTKEIKNGCVHHTLLYDTLKLVPDTPLVLLGNGYDLYNQQLSSFEKRHTIVNNSSTSYFPSITFLGSWGYEQIMNGSLELTDQAIMPLYLKNPDFFSK